MRHVTAAGVCGVVAALAVAAPAGAAPGDAAYGGTSLTKGRIGATSIALVRRADGRLQGRVGLGFPCRRTNYLNVVVRLRGGPTPQGFRVSGSTRLTRRGRLAITLRGAFNGEAASGRVRVRPRRMGCRGSARPFVLGSERPPTGGPSGTHA